MLIQYGTLKISDNYRMDMDELVRSLEWPYSLRDQQKAALLRIIEGRHTFSVLPTGYGKSDILVLAPLLMDKVMIGSYLKHSHDTHT